MAENSPSMSLNKENLKKIGKGALIAIAGALLTYGTEVVAQIDFGEYTALVVAGWAIVANTVRKWYFAQE